MILPWWWWLAEAALFVVFFAGLATGRLGIEEPRRWGAMPRGIDVLGVGASLLAGYVMREAGMGAFWLLLRVGMAGYYRWSAWLERA